MENAALREPKDRNLNFRVGAGDLERLQKLAEVLNVSPSQDARLAIGYAFEVAVTPGAANGKQN